MELGYQWHLVPTLGADMGEWHRPGVMKDLPIDTCQKVMEDHLARIPKHGVRIVPVAIEAEHVSVVIQELLQRIHSLVRAQWLATLVQRFAVTHVRIRRNFLRKVDSNA